VLKTFKKFDRKSQGELDEFEALQLLEDVEQTKTATELRRALKEMDKDKNRKLSYVEFCCCYFEKSYEELNNFADEGARQAALAAAKEAAKKQEAIKEAMEAVKKAEEEAAAKRAAEIEAESKLTGVSGMKAFFARQISNTAESAGGTMSNEQKVHITNLIMT
jgi:hypothetical protein